MSKFVEDIIYSFSLSPIKGDLLERHKKILNTNMEVLGVRTKYIRYAIKYMKDEYDISVLDKFDNKTYEEYFVYMNLLIYYTDKKEVLSVLSKNLNICDTWAITDSLTKNLKFIKKNRDLYFDELKRMLSDENIFVARLSICLLMDLYLDYERISEVVDILLKETRTDYYLIMAIAWFYSFLYIKNKREIYYHLYWNELRDDIKKMTIRKILDSYRVSDEDKEWLRRLQKC